jgi:hypothetical protein
MLPHYNVGDRRRTWLFLLNTHQGRSAYIGIAHLPPCIFT